MKVNSKVVRAVKRKGGGSRLAEHLSLVVIFGWYLAKIRGDSNGVTSGEGFRVVRVGLTK